MQDSPDRVGLAWFTTVRWTTALAAAGAIFAGRNALEIDVPVAPAGAALPFFVLSNFWLMWQVRRGNASYLETIAGILICADVAFLTWLLLQAGGVLNPASVFYLVEIVVAALVLGRRWTWVVTALAVAGYALLFLAQTDQLQAAQTMHPEIGLHMRGMWLAFALTALIIAALVTRLAIAVERRDKALEALRERNARATRVAGLATLAAGAAHELSTPLSTIAVVARELERRLGNETPQDGLRLDAQLIRSETDRCRAILDAMAAQSGNPSGETPRKVRIDEIVDSLRTHTSDVDWRRVHLGIPGGLHVVWPIGAVVRAVTNLINNAAQASAPEETIGLKVKVLSPAQIAIVVVDRGTGMTAEELARAGDPFFTTKAAGKGTGLGLFVARSTAEQLGGSLTLQSTPGSGTTATMTLPTDVTTTESRHGA